MNKKSKNNHEKIHLDKVEEPILSYNQEEKLNEEIEYHPVLEKLILKAIKESEEGKGIPHEEVMRKLKERYPFLNGV